MLIQALRQERRYAMAGSRAALVSAPLSMNHHRPQKTSNFPTDRVKIVRSTGKGYMQSDTAVSSD